MFITTERGARVLTVGGFKFHKHRVNGPRIRWYCGTHNTKGCRANVHTLDDQIIKCHNIHTHQATWFLMASGGNQMIDWNGKMELI